MRAFGRAFNGWLRATIICAVIAGIITAIALRIIGVPYAAALGFISGLFYVLPYIGPIFTAIVVGVIGLLVSPLICIVSIIVTIVLHNVVSNLISPKLMGNSVNVHPAVILIVILIGGAVGNIWGMILAIPIAAALQSILITFYETRTGNTIATPDGALFRTPRDRSKRSASSEASNPKEQSAQK